MTPEQSYNPTPPTSTSPDPSLLRPDRSAAPPGPAVRLITVSAAYGAGGSVVAPALAGRLGLPFLQRVTTSEGYFAEPGPCDEQLSTEEVTPVHRLLAHFTQAMPAGPTQSPPSTHHQDEHLRGRGETGIHRLLAAGGGAVILGRAAAVVLGKNRGYHVRLDGPAKRRVVQGAAIEGISEEQAAERLRAADKARTAYVRRLYRCDPADASLYHLMIDSTAIPLDTVIELIVAAASAHEAPVPEQSETHLSTAPWLALITPSLDREDLSGDELNGRIIGGCCMTFQIRHLRSADHPLVVSVVDQWWGGRSMADKLPRLFFEHFTDTSFAAERDGRLAGFLAGFISQARPGEAYIHFVGVDPAERGGGLGRLLYEAFFRAAQASGCTLVRAVTSPVNRGSIAFHQRMGFQLEPGDAEVDGIPVSSDYDGPGHDRVRFCRILRAL